MAENGRERDRYRNDPLDIFLVGFCRPAQRGRPPFIEKVVHAGLGEVALYRRREETTHFLS